MAGIQYRPDSGGNGSNGAHQLDIAQGHGPAARCLVPEARGKSRDGVRRIPAVMERLHWCARNRVWSIRDRSCAGSRWQLEDRPLPWLRGLDEVSHRPAKMKTQSSLKNSVIE